jgi:predicted amino acid-binding ACT domain protein
MARKRSIIIRWPLFMSLRVEAGGDKKSHILDLTGSRPGVMAFSSILAQHHCNIERIKMIARGEFLGMEMWIDLREADLSRLRADLSEAGKRRDGSHPQPESTFKRKKVIVFDMVRPLWTVRSSMRWRNWREWGKVAAHGKGCEKDQFLAVPSDPGFSVEGLGLRASTLPGPSS